jgi:hypothetical protein
MATDVIDNQGENTEGNENETVTIEQFQALNTQLEESRAMFEKIKEAQSGSDKKVTELQQLLRQKQEEAAEANKTAEEKFADRMAAIESELERTKTEKQQAILKGLAVQLLGDKGIKAPKFLNRLIGQDAEETEALINDYIEERLEVELSVADKFAKDNGRKIQKSTKGDFKTLDDYTDEELQKMPKDEFLKVQERSK